MKHMLKMVIWRFLEAIDYVQRIANYYYGSGIDGYDVEFIEIRDRAKKKQDK